MGKQRKGVPDWVWTVLLVLVIGGFRTYTETRRSKAKAQAKIVAEKQQKAKEEQDRAEAQKRAAADAQRRAKEEQDRAKAAREQEVEDLRAQSREFRIWTDANGRLVTAVFFGSSNEYVNLKARDGSWKRFPKSSLCAADQALLRGLEELPEIKAVKERNQAGIQEAGERRRAAEEQQREAARLAAMKKDAGAVADAYVRGLVDSGILRSATLVGYQRGLGVPLIALYRCSFISQGGFHRVTLCAVALADDRQGEWSVWNFDEDASVFGGLPLCSNWQQVFR